MLRKRLLTILIALPLFLLALWYLPRPWFAGFSAGLVAIAAWEWGCLIPLKKQSARLIFMLGVIAALGLTFVVPIVYWFLAALVVWLWAMVSVINYARGSTSLGMQYPSVRATLAFFMLIPFWLSINILRNTSAGPWLLIFVFVLVWAVDTGGYIAGRTLGRHLLMPRVSPKKTWEGLLGGLLLCALLVFAYGYFYGIAFMQTAWLAALCVTTAIFAVVGDLYESMLKRHVNIKDSSGLLPGHGGILDRFDSAIAALPIFALGMLVLL